MNEHIPDDPSIDEMGSDVPWIICPSCDGEGYLDEYRKCRMCFGEGAVINPDLTAWEKANILAERNRY